MKLPSHKNLNQVLSNIKQQTNSAEAQENKQIEKRLKILEVQIQELSESLKITEDNRNLESEPYWHTLNANLIKDVVPHSYF